MWTRNVYSRTYARRKETQRYFGNNECRPSVDRRRTSDVTYFRKFLLRLSRPRRSLALRVFRTSDFIVVWSLSFFFTRYRSVRRPRITLALLAWTFLRKCLHDAHDTRLTRFFISYGMISMVRTFFRIIERAALVRKLRFAVLRLLPFAFRRNIFYRLTRIRENSC